VIITVRPLRATEGRIFLEIHSRSIRGLAAAHYPAEVLEAWTVPLTEESLRGFLDNRDGEIRLIAELDGEPVGLGALVVANSELRACYVVPEASRKGVGTALVAEIERIAKENGVERLELLASVNAEPFYAFLGYEAHGRTEHVLRTGHPMAAVRMAKMLSWPQRSDRPRQ
jgi:putative acetyltransferase